MRNQWQVEIREDCKTCGGPLLNARSRTYCSDKCRNRAYNQRYKVQQAAWQRNYQDAKASRPSKDRIQCLLCGRWYRQVGTHIVQRHKLTAREYRQQVGFDVKRGQLPEDLRDLKARQVFANKTVDNLKSGKKNWFKPGQPGVGVYKRSAQTLERLHKGTKNL